MPELTPDMLAHMAKALLALGVVVCFFGYRLFLLSLALGGFIAGGLAAGAAGLLVAEDALAALMAAVVGGSAMAILFVFFYSFFLFIGGAVTGLLLAAVAIWAAGAPWGAQAVAVLVAGVVAGGLGAFMLQRFVIISTSAFKGALFTVAGAWYLAQQGRIGPLLIQGWEAVAQSISSQSLQEAAAAGFGIPASVRTGFAALLDIPTVAILLMAFVATAVLGMTVHYTITARRPAEPTPAT